ncbi:MAG: hypothetical protein HZA20_12250 [Nitrospirae bacterium]|nr:hypothetical protein [Nitrospirota bacterium]
MIGIPHILFLGLIEAVIVSFGAALFFWIKNRKLRRALAQKPKPELKPEPQAEAVSQPEPEPEPALAEADIPSLVEDVSAEVEEPMLDLDGSLQTEAAADEQFALPVSALELLRQRNQSVSDAIGMIAVVIESSPEQLHELDALLRASDEMTRAIALISESPASPDYSPVQMPVPEPVEEPVIAESRDYDFEAPPDIELETVDDDVDATDHTLQDIILMSSLQVRILKEQREKLLAALSGDPASMETDRKIHGAITALERENAALRRIAEELEQSGGAPGGGEELASARIEIANLRDELKKAQNEIKSLEHEYDVLYSKSASIAGDDNIM